jgi:hypothetical protein
MPLTNCKITNSYLHSLQAKYHYIDNRGIVVDKEKLREARRFIDQEITRNLAIATDQWGVRVYVGAENAYPKDHPEVANQVNINASSGKNTLLAKLKELGYEVPKIPKKNEAGEYEAKYSTSELALQKMLIANQFNFVGSDPAIRAVLAIRELGKLKSSYINNHYYKSIEGYLLYLTNYNCAGPITGRRSSRKHSYGFGGNAQNFPKHGKLAKIIRKCFIPRDGCIFLMVDQKGAEEWPVNALACNQAAINEMVSGVNRHIRRAARIFNVREDSRTEREWKDSVEYYLGKKTGHANNYGMRANRMSDSLVQEGHVIPPKQCQGLLDTINKLEPWIQGVFQKYVKDTIYATRMLITPYARERQFLGIRPNDNNYKVFNEAFAWIPQSVVGDNTGFAVYELETIYPKEERRIVQEGHDSIVQDIPAKADIIWDYLQRTIKSFDRTIRFYSGIEINIPVEAELGYSFGETIKIKDLSYDGVVQALKYCNDLRDAELSQAAAQAEQQRITDLVSGVTA